MSPPDSGHSSGDDEPNPSSSHDGEKMKELEEAVRKMEINRTGSPELDHSFQFPPRKENDEHVPTGAGKLTKHAAKIVHSRSSTDGAIVYTPPHQAADSPANVSASDGSDEDGDRPPLIRKKSGELVKPAIRPKNRRTASSMPGTPTYGKKGVHFNDDIQQVRHFLQVDRPIAVSAGGSPAQTFEDDREFPFGKQPLSPTLSGYDIRLRNFPRESLERQSQPVRIQRIALSADQKSLLGQVAVANLAFHKTVIARFTFDFWKTTSEVLCQYCNDLRQKPQDGYDQFSFSIKLSDQTNIERKTMFICIRYQVNGQEYWDNNNSMNYQVDFTQKQPTNSPAPGLGSRPIPRSKKNSALPGHTRQSLSADDDFLSRIDSIPPLKLKQPPRNEVAQALPTRRSQNSSQQFSNRYDFGASLTAALNQATGAPGDRSSAKFQNQAQSTQTGRNTEHHKSSITQRHTPTGNAKAETPRADALYANRSSLDSRAYQEFVSKFCFFGSGKSQPTTSSSQETDSSRSDIGQKAQGSSSSAVKQPMTGTDGAQDEKPSVSVRAPEHTISQHEDNTAKSAHREDLSGVFLSPQLFAQTGSASHSPTYGSPVGYGSRSSSPPSIGYGFGKSIDSGVFSGASTPATAIHG